MSICGFGMTPPEFFTPAGCGFGLDFYQLGTMMWCLVEGRHPMFPVLAENLGFWLTGTVRLPPKTRTYENVTSGLLTFTEQLVAGDVLLRLGMAQSAWDHEFLLPLKNIRPVPPPFRTTADRQNS
ncbi:uncharacterized protein LOC143285222 [Babylonia areolata]|uniref:uncharacterized protein LOC143285222 n=1 Tax=Babylonia areolata TaxID=304850 RepID=UPI003FCFC897